MKAAGEKSLETCLSIIIIIFVFIYFDPMIITYRIFKALKMKTSQLTQIL